MSAAREKAYLEAQVAHLSQVVHGRAVVDQAVGVLLVLGRITPAGAWDVLREMSMRAGIPLRQVAGHLVAYARTGELPDAVRGELERHIGAARQPGRMRAAPRSAPDGPPSVPDAAEGGPMKTVGPPSTHQ
ncbi:hypothetical protein GCM10010431_75830 [Streptomyces kunmingensis]